jgi:hypothetical protein
LKDEINYLSSLYNNLESELTVLKKSDEMSYTDDFHWIKILVSQEMEEIDKELNSLQMVFDYAKNLHQR